MFFDLNILLPTPAAVNYSSGQSHKKGKQKQQQPTDNVSKPLFSSLQVAAIEARIDILVHRAWGRFSSLCLTSS